MLTSQLLLSGLDITEDEYSFKAQFILNAHGKSKNVDINELDSEPALDEIKIYFGIEEPAAEIKKQLMEMIMEKANIGSKIIEGDE
jgi:hypothetical protein